jgi:ABC-2 type transport system permease protein
MNGLRATLLVARREAKERARSKAFLASTVVTVLLLGAAVAVVALSDAGGPPAYTVALVGDSPTSLSSAIDAAAIASGALVDVSPLRDRTAVADALELGDIDAAVLDDDTILLGEGTPGQLQAILEIGLRQSRLFADLEANGLDPAEISALLFADDGITIVRAQANDSRTNEGIAFAAIVLLFVVITTYGQWVLMGVLEEKSTRVVELVVSSTSVRSLLAGKVLGIGLLGIGQLILIIALALIGGAVFDLFEIPGGTAATVIWSLIWFILGFAFYAVLNAAAGSLVSRPEDAQAAATPIALVAVTAYMLTFIVIMPNPDGVAARILSLFPPVAPIAFPARIAFVGVPLWEVFTGVAIMVAAVFGVVRLAARVYAGALLAAGGRVKIRDAWRSAGELAAGHD